jgi:hypothetical protein
VYIYLEVLKMNGIQQLLVCADASNWLGKIIKCYEERHSSFAGCE